MRPTPAPASAPTDSSLDDKATPGLTGDNGLDPHAHQLLVQAKKQRKKIDRAIRTANLNAWISGGLAVCCLPFALFSMASALTGLVLAIVSYVEFRGRKMLCAMDLRGPVVLASNQLIFGAIIIVYAAVQLYFASIGEGSYEQTIAKIPELETLLGPTGQIIRTISMATYVLLILGTLAFQGGMAYYYHSRQGVMRTYLAQTPRWVIDVQRAAA